MKRLAWRLGMDHGALLGKSGISWPVAITMQSGRSNLTAIPLLKILVEICIFQTRAPTSNTRSASIGLDGEMSVFSIH